ncbi:MAG: hypothetical protein ACXVY9_09480, partial [Terriglobales bacterium]
MDRFRALLRAGVQHAREFRKDRNLRQAISPVLVIVGAVLLGYVGGQYGEMFYEQHQLARAWEQQQQARHAALPNPASTTVTQDGLTRLSAPKIDLDSVVVEGTTYRSLLLG